MSSTEKTIGVRELVRSTKAVSRQTRRGVSFIVTRNSKPVFRIEPIDVSRTRTVEDFLALKFKGDANLSKRIDEIVYADRR